MNKKDGMNYAPVGKPQPVVREGEFVFAAAVAIGAEPSPDSLENTPLDTPLLKASIIVAPTNPPKAAVPVNADFIISEITSGILPILVKIIIRDPIT